MSDVAKRRMLRRRDYTADLVAVTPLHIGAGSERSDLLDPVKGADDGETRPLVSAIQRDAAGCPWLPGSALKGALRALEVAPDLSLFGEIKHSNTGLGVMGALMVRGSAMVAPGPTKGLPVPRDAAGRSLAGDGVYVAARTAIDSGRGVAEANKLFHAEMVAPGARFRLRLRLETPGDIDALEASLGALLTAWKAPEGVPVGADAASGLGRLRLDGAVTRVVWAPDARGALVAGAEDAFPLPEAARRERPPTLLRLTCEGPFLTRDPGAMGCAATEADADDAKGNVIHALRLGDAPFITGQALSGALRARLAWLIALERHRGNAVAEDAVDRLFGVIGRRGVLTVMVESSSRAEAAETTSVRIDRFSGGTIDNALFTVDADLCVTIDLRLMLDRRAQEGDEAVLKILVNDLTANGLTLGHGVNRGFGWFRVEVR